METKSILMDRFKSFLDFYALSPDSLAKKIGGSRGTYFNIKNGKSVPDYYTLENILKNFPEISAEWLFRGEGPMLKSEILSPSAAEKILAENRAIKEMYKAELMGKPKGVSSYLQDHEGASEFFTQTTRRNKFPYNNMLLGFTRRFSSNQ